MERPPEAPTKYNLVFSRDEVRYQRWRREDIGNFNSRRVTSPTDLLGYDWPQVRIVVLEAWYLDRPSREVVYYLDAIAKAQALGAELEIEAD